MRIRPIRYRQNPDRMGGKVYKGRKVYDEVTGFHCYEDDLTTDEFGAQVDYRKNGYQADPKNH